MIGKSWVKREDVPNGYRIFRGFTAAAKEGFLSETALKKQKKPIPKKPDAYAIAMCTTMWETYRDAQGRDRRYLGPVYKVDL